VSRTPFSRSSDAFPALRPNFDRVRRIVSLRDMADPSTAPIDFNLGGQTIRGVHARRPDVPRPAKPGEFHKGGVNVR
jgi:hypothetical protein